MNRYYEAYLDYFRLAGYCKLINADKITRGLCFYGGESPPDPFFENVSVLYENKVRQSDFEKGVISPWVTTYSGTAASASVSRSCSKSVRLGIG